MHQPYYREGLDGKYQLPWVYLHGIKDYTDMAAHLENHPDMRAVVNFSPILLEQLDNYVNELGHFLKTKNRKKAKLSDPLLGLLTGVEDIPTTSSGRQQIVDDCKRCYAPRLIDPYPAFKCLVESLNAAYETVDAEHYSPIVYLQDQYFIDLIVWYHLAWLGESLRHTEVAQRLMQKEHNYSLQDRYQLTELIHESLAGIIPRYRQLSEAGRVELSVTPYAHPIIPLLNNFDNMQCSQPGTPAPESEHYPNGYERSRWHMEKGLEVFEHYFHTKPKGVWLSEGALSPDAIELLDEYGITWTASGEDVWRNTCRLSGCNQEEVHNKKALFKPYQYQDCNTKMYFRDDGLSDFIGFEYSHWNAQDAAYNFVENLENIANFLGDDADKHVVSVILDGENAWEYYVDNGYPFLDALYTTMSSNPRINMTTFAETSAQENIHVAKVDQICSGSWVYVSFSTWIGDKDKNRAWDYLVTAKKTYDKKISTLSKVKQKKAALQLATCEGSDWFWWFGDYNSANSVNDFDILFRAQLTLLYKQLGVSPPSALDQPISVGGGDSENSGTMRRNK